MDLDTHYFANTSLAAGGFFLVGDKGDDDPGHAVQQALLTNDGTVVLRVGASLTGVKGTRWKSLPVGQTLPFDLAEGLDIHNPHASTAGAISGFALCARGKELDWSGRKGRKDNAKIDTRYLTPRLTFTPGAVADTTLLFPRKVTISSLKVETLVTVTGGVITLDVLNEANESLLSAVFDLEALSPTYGDLLTDGRTVAKVRGEVDLDDLPEGVDDLGDDPAAVRELLAVLPWPLD